MSPGPPESCALTTRPRRLQLVQSRLLIHCILLLLFVPSQGVSLCPPGFFLRGLYRGANHNIGNIEWSKCCKPSHHPYEYNGCYNEDVSNTFNKAGLSECKQPGHFIVGFKTMSGDHKLSNIVQFKCCKMADGRFSSLSLSAMSCPCLT